MSKVYSRKEEMRLAQSFPSLFVGGIGMIGECVRDALETSDSKNTKITDLVAFAVGTCEDRIETLPRRLDLLEPAMALRAGVQAGADELLRREVEVAA